MAISNFGRNIKTLREINSLTQQQLADALEVTQNTVGGWETRDKKPKQPSIIAKICNMFGVSEQDLFGFSDGLYAKNHGLPQSITPFTSDTTAPILGNVAAGDPKEAIQLSGERLWVPPNYLEADPDSFYLCVTSNSQNKHFQIGDYILVSPNTEVHNGDIAAVMVNGDDATVKRFKKYDGAIYLEPDSTDPSYKRIIIDETDPDAPLVRVLGKVVWHYPQSKY